MIILSTPNSPANTQSRHRIGRLAALCLLALLLGACAGGLTVSVNDQAVYDPQGRIGGENVRSANLQGCINLSMQQQKVETPEELTVLSCPESEINNLENVGVLKSLRFLDLTGNAISNVTPLENLDNLSGLILARNSLRDVNTLINLSTLTSLNITGNDAIPCRQVSLLREKLGDNLIAGPCRD